MEFGSLRIEPVLFTFTQYSHNLPKNAHVVLTARDIFKRTSKEKIPNISFRKFQYPYWPGLPADLLIKKNKNIKVKIATILSGDRIQNTLESYSKVMTNIYCDFLEKNNVEWYLIGVENQKQ